MKSITKSKKITEKRLAICSGYGTCFETCKCKYPHEGYKILGGPPITEESLNDKGMDCTYPNWGSCYHKNHSDFNFHESYHELISLEEWKNIKRTNLIDKMLSS